LSFDPVVEFEASPVELEAVVELESVTEALETKADNKFKVIVDVET